MEKKLTLTVGETAQRLGIGKNKTYTLVHDGKIPSIRLGKTILIPIQALDAWLQKAATT